MAETRAAVIVRIERDPKKTTRRSNVLHSLLFFRYFRESLLTRCFFVIAPAAWILCFRTLGAVVVLLILLRNWELGRSVVLKGELEWELKWAFCNWNLGRTSVHIDVGLN
uniref:Uncharacterized protein n=1 Tax=Solanum tuberosum TaxID=4113 RepID=M1DNA7_SOLTU